MPNGDSHEWHTLRRGHCIPFRFPFSCLSTNNFTVSVECAKPNPTHLNSLARFSGREKSRGKGTVFILFYGAGHLSEVGNVAFPATLASGKAGAGKGRRKGPFSFGLARGGGFFARPGPILKPGGWGAARLILGLYVRSAALRGVLAGVGGFSMGPPLGWKITFWLRGCVGKPGAGDPLGGKKVVRANT